ncbi:PREDICTED: small subunit processome component 20 homolog [Nicrophorus vespilloides]|uniref:Small subunit processome component 20 homolog n=1 Tax=Nicrophorus vespilloides TaxID=110193 RepID=A0ABM1NHI3_NICVS|nr:PREDICTED: small subunit processome component 20 homolog [Nicrophorus vespilloides]
MKNKPLRHKADNVFKFQRFAERISQIDVDVVHKVPHRYEDQEEEEISSNFHKAIEKWDLLNLTESYELFKKEAKPRNIVTLPQLLHNKDHVVKTLIKHLKFNNILCQQPLLEIVSAVAQDLHNDFYEYYIDILDTLVGLLKTKESDLIEWTFQCLAKVFKILWRTLVKDIGRVLTTLLPLLSSNYPDYITDFAAESFAFVARKVKDRNTFLKLILKSIKHEKQVIIGCGKLLFQVLQGIEGQFHSCADTFFPFLLQSLGNEKLPQDELFEILEQIIINISENIKLAKIELVWKSFNEILQKLFSEWNAKAEESTSKLIDQIFTLIGQLIELKHGKLLPTPSLLIPQIKTVIGLSKLPQEILVKSINISVLLLLSPNIKLSQEEGSGLIRKILLINNADCLLHFVANTLDYSTFEAQILPVFLKYCVQSDFENKAVRLLSKIILSKSALCEDGINFGNWNKYEIDFKGSNSKIEGIIKLHIVKVDLDKIEDYVCALISIPHLCFSDLSDFREILKKNFAKGCGEIEGEKDEALLKKKLFLLHQNFECLTHICAPKELLNFENDIKKCVLPLCTDVRYVTALKILDLFYTVLASNEKIVNSSILKVLDEKLRVNFNSPYHMIRLLTCHVYTLFEQCLSNEINRDDLNIFNLCYNVESITAQVDTYRDQLYSLEKLSFEKQESSSSLDYKFVAVRYMSGVLYMNFKLLWEPTVKLIQSHAHRMDKNEFWPVYVEILKQANGFVQNPPSSFIECLNVEFDLINDLYRNNYEIKDKPDFNNHRRYLWKALAQFPEYAESKSKDISQLLLDFIKDEYLRSNSDIASSCNIKKHDSDLVNETIDDEMEEQEDNKMEDDEERGKKELEEIKKKLNRAGLITGLRNATQTLQQYLEVFSKVRNPRSLYKETELYHLYLDLLSHKDSKIQRAALDCLLTYKFKYLLPYKQNLYNLIDDKDFKNELTMFTLGKENSTVQEEYRADLLPIVMKIVHAKMITKFGLRSGGKSGGFVRRNLILRFLAGCKNTEMMSFMKMSFKLYNNFIKDDISAMVGEIMEQVDLENFLPPKRILSGVNLLGVVMKQFGNHMDEDLLRYILKILFVVGAHIKGAYKNRPEIYIGYLPTLRTIRTSCLSLVQQFFEHFEDFAWTAQEVNVLYDLFVWPYLDKMKFESLKSPTTLLKLLCYWGKVPRYFSLLVKYHTDDRLMNPMQCMMELILKKDTHMSVINSMLETVEKMLRYEKSEDEDMVLAIPVDNLLPITKVSEQVQIKGKLNYGTSILVPHVLSILEVIRRKLKVHSINHAELFILSRISELSWDSKTNEIILNLLLPVVLKKCVSNKDEDVIMRYLVSINNMLKIVETPEVYLPKVSPLFGCSNFVTSRKLLCQILETMSKGNKDIQDIYEIANGLNAFDTKWVDQPNFQKRFEAFKRVNEIVSSQKPLSKEIGILVIYNCYYMLNNESDLSLRENSSHCLKTLTPYLVNQVPHVDQKYVIEETILAMIKDGMKSKKMNLRNECISLLGNLARECAHTNVILQDLNKLTDKHDLEVDFFENLVHLQVHRHGKALTKFMKVFKNESSLPKLRTLTQYILPLAAHYLCNETFSTKHQLIDTSAETIGVVCRLLPQQIYLGVLKYYLNKLRTSFTYQKQLVKVVVQILDAFHYDLSQGQVEPPKVIPRVEYEEGKDEDEEEQQEPELGDIEDELEKEEFTETECKPFDKITVLSKATATKLTGTIQEILLPQLHRSLATLSHRDKAHKLNKKMNLVEKEEEDLLRVPISLAVVKLLQRLPKKILDTNLPGVLMKLCTFLKSKLESVRRTARETLQNIMKALGPKYLNVLLEVIIPLLTKGFQVHVLVFTIHAVLNTLKDQYQPTDVDKIMLMVIEICKADLFGILSEEKSVVRLIEKTSEAKSMKSYAIFQILAQYITDKCIMDLLLPLKQILSGARSFKHAKTVEECLRNVTLGLIDNQFITVSSLIMFAYGVSSESIPNFMNKDAKPVQAAPEKLLTVQTDSYLIPKEPVGRTMALQAKNSANAHEHIIIEFGLHIVYFILKREKLHDEELKPLLDPFVKIFSECLNSKHVKINTVTMQCLQWVVKMDMPSMRENMKDIVESLFAILHKYATPGLQKGDNFDLVVAAFKVMTVFIRDVKYVTLDKDQLKVLLLYVEQDLHDNDKQAIAFTLLKAIISRKLVAKEVYDIMQKVAELSIISELTHIRHQSRTVFLQYLMDYPLKNKFYKLIDFYLAQLKYEVQVGRESALEMVQSFIRNLPLKILKELSPTLFVQLGMRLVNEDVPSCRKTAAECIRSVLSKITKTERDPLFNMTLSWLKDKKVLHKRLAAQLCGLLIIVEKASFEDRLPNLIPLVILQFGPINEGPGKCVLLSKDEEIIETDDKQDKNKDHHLYQVLQMILKLCTNCPNFLKDSRTIENLAVHAQSLLAYDHEWVRLGAAQFLGFIFSTIDIEKLSKLLMNNEKLEGAGFLYSDPHGAIKSLTLDFCAQLQPNAIKCNLAEQVIKNLLFIAKVIKDIPISTTKVVKENNEMTINLLWLVKLLRKSINLEIRSGSIVLRHEIFKWIGGIVTVMDFEVYKPIMFHLMAPLVRELTTSSNNTVVLRRLAKDVAKIIKNRVGIDVYTEYFSQINQKLEIKKSTKKRQATQLAVTDPEAFAQKKIKLNEKKKDAKKRKIRKMKDGTYVKQKEVDLEQDMEE